MCFVIFTEKGVINILQNIQFSFVCEPFNTFLTNKAFHHIFDNHDSITVARDKQGGKRESWNSRKNKSLRKTVQLSSNKPLQ